MTLEISTVGVIGLGTMGAGIAEIVSRSGYRVIAIDMTDATLANARANVEASTARALKRGKLTEDDRDSLLGRVTYSTNLEDLSAADLVIEAIPEQLELKRELFAKLDAITPVHAVLASNTSSLSVTDISVATKRPAQVVGLHFFNPAPVQAFVEVVRTVISDESVIDTMVAFAESLGRKPVVIGDKAGFIANALLFGYLNHAVSMFEQKYASREDIDDAMRLGCGYPMGPLALIDLIGLDTSYEILDTMYKQGRDRLHAPSPILKQMVTAGLRGRKSGRGFFSYEAPNSPVVVPDSLTPSDSVETTSGRSVQSVGVIGSGTMASGIAEVIAKAGKDVVLVGRSESSVKRARSKIENSTAKAVDKGRLDPAARDAALARVSISTEVSAVAGCDLVIECIVEEIEPKLVLFRELDTVCRAGAVLATTTSSLPVVDLAAATSRPSDVIGIHFFNPAPVMKLVEVVTTVATRTQTLDTSMAFVKDLGKHPVICGDRAGFIVNALLFPYLNDAIRMVEANYASTDDIDVAMKRGCGLPMGPFELLDTVGLDVALEIQRTLYHEFREPGFAPAPRLEHLVTAGYLGRKSGRGFRVYES